MPVKAVAAAVRAATPEDLPALYALITHYSQQGVLLPRTEQDLARILGAFRVISADGMLLGCAMLQPYTARVGELRSLAIAPEARGTGLGRALVEAVLAEGAARGFEMVFAFTYATEFFAKLGFARIDRELLPWKVWNDCIHCPKRECCDEIAVARWLKSPGSRPFPLGFFPLISDNQ